MSSAVSRIPRILHFVWFGSVLPPLFERLIEIAVALHPNWEIRTWDESAIVELIREMGTGLEGLFTDLRLALSTRSDIARYHIVAEKGGFYFDTDFLFLRNIEVLTNQSFVGFAQANGLVATAAFGAVARHSILRSVLGKLAAVDYKLPADQSAGPSMFDTVCRQHVSSDPESMILRGECVFPVDYSEKHNLVRWQTCPLQSGYAAHLWAHSWSPGGGDEMHSLYARVGALLLNHALTLPPK